MQHAATQWRESCACADLQAGVQACRVAHERDAQPHALMRPRPEIDARHEVVTPATSYSYACHEVRCRAAQQPAAAYAFEEVSRDVSRKEAGVLRAVTVTSRTRCRLRAYDAAQRFTEAAFYARVTSYAYCGLRSRSVREVRACAVHGAQARGGAARAAAAFAARQGQAPSFSSMRVGIRRHAARR